VSVREILTGASAPQRWGLILAGGEGARLRPLTRAITGDERPKQFCAVLGRETLLDQTRRRAALAIPPARTLLVLTRKHERFYRPLIAGMPSRCAVIQPEDRGTAPAILYGLLRIACLAPMGAVAIVPSDHYVSDDARFMSHVTTAFATVQARPDLVVLLGIEPESAETEYGWIEGGEPIAGASLFRVRRFVEKPSQAVAGTLLERGCLWNSFVMVGRIPAFLAMIRRSIPGLDAAFATVRQTLGTPAESAAVRTLYSRLSPSSLSHDVLAARVGNLVVLPVRGIQWSDWGAPERVMDTLARLGVTPAWAGRLTAQTA
jgi:mannose-1-phosphate guanylyltransferase